MQRLLISVCLLVGLAASATAQTPVPSVGPFGKVSIPCGGTLSATNASSQYGWQGFWLQYTVTSSIPANLCISQTYVDAYVGSVSGSAGHNQATWTASIRRQIMVPRPNLYLTNGSHAYRVTAWPVPTNALLTQSAAEILLKEAPTYDPARQCEAKGGTWNGVSCIMANTPIVIALDGGPYKLTSPQDGVRFDLDGDGVAEQVAWTAPGSRVAFLATDRNHNGRIDDGTELYGNHTPVLPGDPAPTAPNGFEALRFTEATGSQPTSDDAITPADPLYATLLLWVDANHDGVSQPDELQSATQASLGTILLDAKVVGRKDAFGNRFSLASTRITPDGQKRVIYDVRLQAQK